MNKKLMCGDYLRPVAGMVPQESDYLTWVLCNDTDKQVWLTKDVELTAACTKILLAREARVLAMVGSTHGADKKVSKLVNRISPMSFAVSSRAVPSAGCRNAPGVGGMETPPEESTSDDGP